MKGQNFVSQFQLMANNLMEHSMIDVLICEFNNPATEEELSSARNIFSLTSTMTDFYSQANGIQILWRSQVRGKSDHDESVGGYINLLPIQEVFKDWINIVHFDGDNNDEKHLYPIDFFAGNACAAVYLDNTNNPQIYYYYRGRKMNSLGIDFEGYLRLLLKSRGFHYWYLTIAKSEDESSTLSMEEQRFREIMPQLFPDFSQLDFQRLR
jgi:hypothetical protein